MNVLLGILPGRDWSGNEVPGGERYVAEGWRESLIQLRGDWEFLCAVFRFPYWNAAGNLCWMCSATNAVCCLLWTAGHRCAAVVRHGRHVALHGLGGSRRASWLMSSCDASRSGRGEPLHTRRTVNDLDDEIPAWYRQKGEVSKLQGKLTLARLRSSDGYPKLKAKGAATRHMGVLHPGSGCSALCWSKRPLRLGVVQTLADIYHILEEKGVFLPDARQFHLLYNRSSPRGVGGSPCGQRVEDVPEVAPVHPFDGVAGD